MARIRSLKPELPEDETLGRVSRDARLMFILLWTRCDDLGPFRAAPALLRGLLFPYDDDITNNDARQWRDELVDVGRIRLYAAGGQEYGVVVNWAKHQRIDNASKSTLPDPPWADTATAPPASEQESAPDDQIPPQSAETRREPPQTADSLGGSPLDGKGRDRKGEEYSAAPQAADTPSTVAPNGKAPPPATRREPDHLWDALIEACGIDQATITPTARGGYNRALKELRSVNATPDAIRQRARTYRARWPSTTLTPAALAKHWAACARPPTDTASALSRPSTQDRNLAAINAVLGEPHDHRRSPSDPRRDGGELAPDRLPAARDRRVV